MIQLLPLVSPYIAEPETLWCVCFQDYQGDKEDSDWVQCACKRWEHKDCINDIVYDAHGREPFHP